MQVTRIFPLEGLLTETQAAQCHEAQTEAAKVWNTCCALHKEARKHHTLWPRQRELQAATKNLFKLNAQSVQQISRVFLGCVGATKANRASHPQLKFKYPHREKRFYPVLWPAQAVHQEKNRLVLPMGRGNPSLILPLVLPEGFTMVKLVWNDAFELHVNVPIVVPEPMATEGERATIDLGEIHLAALTTTSEHAEVITGRKIRSIKRFRAKALGQISRKRSRCTRGSRRDKKLAAARRKVSRRAQRQVRDLRHKATTQVVKACVEHNIKEVFIGNPHGVRRKNSGRRHNDRMAKWEYGQDIQYLTYKFKKAGIRCSTGSERGTSSTCPECSARRKPKGRTFTCTTCGFTGHRDLVGSANMHVLAFNARILFPRAFTYRQPGTHAVQLKAAENVLRGSRSRPDTGLTEATQCVACVHAPQHEGVAPQAPHLAGNGRSSLQGTTQQEARAL